MSTEDQLTELSGHVIVCGLGHVGYRCVMLLDRLGEKAAVITKETSETWRLTAAERFPVLLGDARNEHTLKQAGIERAKAIIVATDDHLANLSIALDARQLNGRIAIVVRMFDQELAQHLEKSVKIDRVLSASALAAPVFEAAALGASLRGILTAHEGWCAFEEHVLEDTAAEQSVADWQAASGQAVIARQRAGQVCFRPPGSERLLAGDRIVTLSFARRDPRPTLAIKRAKLRERLRLGGQVLHLWWRHLPLGLRAAFVLLLGVVVVSIGVFHWALELSLIDAFYFVVTTITTVGYGDFNLKDASPWMKLYGSFVMLCGAAIVAAMFSIFADVILSARLRDVLARGRARAREHIIVVGLGNLGFRIVEDLIRRGETVVAVEQRDSPLVAAARESAAVMVGSFKAIETLEKAGIGTARALIAATDDDLANLSIALAAKRAKSDCRVVLRIFDSELAAKMHAVLDLDAVLSMSAASAPSFVAAALQPDVLQAFVLSDYLVAVFSRTVAAGSAYIGRSPVDMAEDESAFFVKPAGARKYQEAAANQCLAAGDEVIGARWHRFSA